MSDVSTMMSTPTPVVQEVGLERPWTWLACGWQDLLKAPSVSLSYGAVFVVGSFLLTWGLVLVDVFYLILPLAAGFMFAGPILAVGFYDVSRRLAVGKPATLASALTAWRVNTGQFLLMGLLLMLFLLAWIRIATLIFALFFGMTAPTWDYFIYEVFLSFENFPFLVTGTADVVDQIAHPHPGLLDRQHACPRQGLVLQTERP